MTEARTGTCLGCEWLYMNLGEPRFSEWTPGQDFECHCRLGKWAYDRNRMGEREYQKALASGRNCELFQLADWAEAIVPENK